MISSPEDYGLSPADTLSHHVDAVAPEGFARFWEEFRQEIAAIEPAIVIPLRGTTCRLEIPSMDGLIIRAQAWLPAGSPRAVMVTSHGYDHVPGSFDLAFPGLLEQNVAVVEVRVRGFLPSPAPPSMPSSTLTWIEADLGKPDRWIVRGAVADLICACRVVSRRMAAPLILHGSSFGGGLATLAAAQMTLLGEPPDRLALELPSFGAWRWRHRRYCNGIGGTINQWTDAMRRDVDSFLEHLSLFDAVLHAPDVYTPTFCKLALRDDTVPAPSAAAIYNALKAPIKTRFIVPYGHFDGGLLNARRHAMFDRLLSSWCHPGIEPAEFIDTHKSECEAGLSLLNVSSDCWTAGG